MGLFGDFKEKQKEIQQKQQERTAKIPMSFKAEYLGGYKDYNKKTEGRLFIHQDKVRFMGASGFHTAKFEIAKSDIKELAVEGQDQVGKRITATRLLTTGVLAFAWQKKTKQQDTYVTVVTNDGQEAIFHIEGKSHMELKPQIQQKIGLSTTAPTQAQPASDSTADELTKLAELKEKGILTQAEFDAKKKQLLGL